MGKKTKNNAGLSLIELLVALAVGSVVMSAIVLLLSQGLRHYSKQTINSQLQDEVNIALNQISDAVMEAQYIEITNESSMGNTTVFVTKKGSNGNVYVYNQTEKKLYVGISTAESELSPVCKYVDAFNVEIIPLNNSSVVDYTAPIQVKVTLRLKLETITKEMSRVTNVRNQLSTDCIKTNDSTGGV